MAAPQWITNAANWLRELLSPPPAADPAPRSDLSKASTFVAAGFAGLTAILAFFGIKDGTLDRIIQAEPAQGLYVFCLIGLGLLCGILAAFLPEKTKEDTVRPMKAFWLVVAIGVLGFFTLWILTDLGVKDARAAIQDLVVALVVGGVVLALVCADKGWEIPLIAAILCFGVAATSMGLYGVTKIAVMSKGPDVRPQVGIEVHNGDAPKVTLKVKAARRGDDKLRLTLVGTRVDDHRVEIGSVVLTPDGAGAIDETVTFPATATGWEKLVVEQCDITRDSTCSQFQEVARLALGSKSEQARVSGAIAHTEVDGVHKQTLRAYAVPAGSQLEVSAVRERQGESGPVQHAMVEPADDGTVTWTSSLVGCQAGDKLTLHYRVCPEGKCAGESMPIASYVVP
ncbi:hypothetical protein LFM09_08285 [Lentzea alba]|uniref:hypothetical protein n=1 Tax=Lentzea alba TaxID=2714351 RepID=UPI0039BEE71E